MKETTKTKKGFLESIPSFSLVLIMVILIIIGAALIPLIKISYQPSQKENKNLSINFSWSGASPRVIEQEVTSKIEGIVSSVNGVEKVSSDSNVGSGYVMVKLKDDASVDAVRFEISSLIKQIASKLPEGVSYPSLSQSSGSMSLNSSKTLLSYRINADMQENQIEDYAKSSIKPIIEKIKGVTDVNISGAMPQDLKITYDPILLKNYGLNAGSIREAISNYIGRTSIIGDVTKSGTENDEKSRITILLSVEKGNGDMSKIPVTKIDGKIIYLGDIATLNYIERTPNNFYRINGLNTIYLTISVDKDANLIKMSELVRNEMEDVKTKLIDNFFVELTYDSAKEIKTELYKLIRRTTLSLAILLVFVLIASRSFRYMSIIALTLIANVLIAVILYYVFDLELHMFSLAGIAVSFGIIIDTSIVMVDHYSYYHNRKVFIAILAALLTTIGSLVIIFFMPDYIRNQLNDFSMVIIINLAVSLVVALLFVPAIIDRYKYSSRESQKRITTRRFIVKFSKIYRRYIHFTQKRKWIYIVIFILTFGIPIHLLPNKIGKPDYFRIEQEKKEPKWYEDVYNKTIGSSFYQSKLKKPLEYSLGGTFRLFSGTLSSRNFSMRRDKPTLNISARPPEGGTIEQLNRVVVEMDKFLSQYDEIDRFETRIDGQEAGINVTFKKESEKAGFPLYLKNMVISHAISLGGADWSVYGIDQNGFSNSLNLDNKSNRIGLSGYNYDNLYRYAEELAVRIAQNKRVSGVEIEGGGGNSYFGMASSKRNEMYIKYDMEKVALYGFNLSRGYNALSELLSSGGSGTYTDKDGSRTDITLASSRRDEFDTWSLLNSYINVDGVQLRYSYLGDISKRKSETSIPKSNQEYSLNVAFNFTGSYEYADKFIKGEIEKTNSLLPVGYKCTNSSYGWYDDRGQQYWLILVIVVLIFFMCSILFESLSQPIVIISLIPISFIGVFLTFYFSGVSFGTGGFAALVLLSGLVVNAAIYIINEYNNSRKYFADNNINISPLKLYVKSYNHKIIPVLLTILSTVLGLIPFLVDGTDEMFWFSFAIGTTGGLLFSVVAIIFFMPILMPLRQKIKK